MNHPSLVYSAPVVKECLHPLVWIVDMKSFASNFAESLDSISQTDITCVGDWQEEVFRKVVQCHLIC